MKVLILLSDAFSPINFPPWPSSTTFSNPSRSDCRIIFLKTWVDITKIQFITYYEKSQFSIKLFLYWNVMLLIWSIITYLLADLHENKLLVAFVERVTFWTFEAFLLDLSFLAFLCIVQSEHSDLVHQEHIHKILPFFHTRKDIYIDRIHVRKQMKCEKIHYTSVTFNATYFVLNIFICSTF